jgi:hypothetical protein
MSAEIFSCVSLTAKEAGGHCAGAVKILCALVGFSLSGGILVASTATFDWGADEQTHTGCQKVEIPLSRAKGIV